MRELNSQALSQVSGGLSNAAIVGSAVLIGAAVGVCFGTLTPSFYPANIVDYIALKRIRLHHIFSYTLTYSAIGLGAGIIAAGVNSIG